jgi:hypothetical protein
MTEKGWHKSIHYAMLAHAYRVCHSCSDRADLTNLESSQISECPPFYREQNKWQSHALRTVKFHVEFVLWIINAIFALLG